MSSYRDRVKMELLILGITCLTLGFSIPYAIQMLKAKTHPWTRFNSDGELYQDATQQPSKRIIMPMYLTTPIATIVVASSNTVICRFWKQTQRYIFVVASVMTAAWVITIIFWVPCATKKNYLDFGQPWQGVCYQSNLIDTGRRNGQKGGWMGVSRILGFSGMMSAIFTTASYGLYLTYAYRDLRHSRRRALSRGPMPHVDIVYEPEYRKRSISASESVDRDKIA
ncbi:hypothetical protein CC78DRAFT_584096 [Lojkania enalia]|uniref:Uncharacterized protein n=1 Tax=Lojkania enalia TaxID=147567 RepID=A0A9P4N3R3_9PLEO|nr:hypothetical protein CC78DRAFT_584096 [Didymosphaeria enalia]